MWGIKKPDAAIEDVVNISWVYRFSFLHFCLLCFFDFLLFAFFAFFAFLAFCFFSFLYEPHLFAAGCSRLLILKIHVHHLFIFLVQYVPNIEGDTHVYF